MWRCPERDKIRSLPRTPTCMALPQLMRARSGQSKRAPFRSVRQVSSAHTRTISLTVKPICNNLVKDHAGYDPAPETDGIAPSRRDLDPISPECRTLSLPTKRRPRCCGSRSRRSIPTVTRCRPGSIRSARSWRSSRRAERQGCARQRPFTRSSRSGRVRPRIAVGMPIAGHPPHGSGRAQFEHPAPTLGV